MPTPQLEYDPAGDLGVVNLARAQRGIAGQPAPLVCQHSCSPAESAACEELNCDAGTVLHSEDVALRQSLVARGD
jgi:hypothetical protein